jgi:hypothetical protein
VFAALYSNLCSRADRRVSSDCGQRIEYELNRLGELLMSVKSGRVKINPKRMPLRFSWPSVDRVTHLLFIREACYERSDEHHEDAFLKCFLMPRHAGTRVRSFMAGISSA